ncbi:MAG TPA: SDR family oxidoreductase [Pseudonocardia sp.]
MDLSGARVLVAGATGVLGGAIARALHAQGARVALAGRDEEKLSALADELDGAPTAAFDALDLDRCAAAVGEAADALGGLDLLVVAIGIAAFGSGTDEDDAVAEELLTVNTMAPMALVRAALPRIGKGGGVAVLTAILADYPTAGMAAYSASKAGLSAWLTALRPEQRRRGVAVFDIRPPHIETGLAGRAVAGQAPPMKEGATVDEAVGLIVDGIRDGRRELRFDLQKGEFVLR